MLKHIAVRSAAIRREVEMRVRVQSLSAQTYRALQLWALRPER